MSRRIEICAVTALLAVACGGKNALDALPIDAVIVDVSIELPVDGASPDTFVVEAATPPSVTATLKAMPNNAIGAIAVVIATPGASLVVEYGDTLAYGKSTKSVLVPASGSISIPVLGLLQKSTAHARVRAEKGGLSTTTADLAIATGSLPFDLSGRIQMGALLRSS